MRRKYFLCNDSVNDWVLHQLLPGHMLWNHPQRATFEKTINNLIANSIYSNDRAVSSVSFGFWTHLFSRRPFFLGGQSLLKIFPERSKGIGQRVIYKELQEIKAFRNRVAHQESICFDKNGNINTQGFRYVLSLIIKYLQYLGYSDKKLLYGYNVMTEPILDRIDSL